MNKPLSNNDIAHMIRKLDGEQLNMMKFDDITPSTTIEDIFDGRGHVLFFQKHKNSNVGHWTSLVRNNNNQYVFFDSFGRPISYFNKYLAKILNGTIYNNMKKYQNDKSSVCGRYAYMLIALNKLSNGQNTQKYMTELLKNKPKKLSFDEFIIKLT